METIFTKSIQKAKSCILSGGVIIFPTETVFGIGCNAFNHKACKKIYKIKNRPKDNPLIIHTNSFESICKIAHVPDQYISLIQKLTPGPITFILKKKDSTIFSNGLTTIGVRIPSHSITNQLLNHLDCPIAAPSANLSGKPSITNVRDVRNVFQGKVNLILNGSPSKIGIESTVLDLTSNPPVILRPGFISFEKLKKWIPNLKKNPSLIQSTLKSPGLRYKHYAPNCNVILLEKSNLKLQSPNSAQIGFRFSKKLDFNVKIKNNLEYMRKLYSFFIQCDVKRIKTAYCHLPLNDQWFDPLMNRLTKASGKI